jgi:DNA (cytosine-5)-methyltransferase 1
MIFGSVCSGIEAASVAWGFPGWRAAFLAETAAFPRAVLKHHYPDVPLHGDFTTIARGEYGPIDVLVGGTPCQDFSVAGLRAGIAGERGNLTLEFLRLAGRLRPEWVVWENVPGVLSLDGGRAFGAVLGGLGQLGYGFAYRVLDAQYFGLAQRRSRVFVVGHLGDWRRAAAVLFERESLSGDPPPRRQERQDVAPTLASRPTGGGGNGTDFDLDGGLIAGCLQERDSKGASSTPKPGHLIVAHALRADGFDASEGRTYTHEGKNNFAENVRGEVRESAVAAALSGGGGKPGQGYPAVMSAMETKDASTQEANAGTLLRALRREVGAEAFAQWGLGILNSLQRPQILQQALHGCGIRRAAREAGCLLDDGALPRAESVPAGPMRALWQDGPDGRSSQGRQLAQQLARELGAAVPQLPHQDTSPVMTVRRLTPAECELLMGFPDGYTLVEYRGKPAADGPRYKALGNSMAVPVMRWIGERIQLVADL